MSTPEQTPVFLAEAEALSDRGMALAREGKATLFDNVLMCAVNAVLAANAFNPVALREFSHFCVKFTGELNRVLEDIEEEHQ